MVIHTVKGFGVVNKAEVDFFWNSLTLLMIVTQVKNFICPFSAQTIEPLVLLFLVYLHYPIASFTEKIRH